MAGQVALFQPCSDYDADTARAHELLMTAAATAEAAAGQERDVPFHLRSLDFVVDIARLDELTSEQLGEPCSVLEYDVNVWLTWSFPGPQLSCISTRHVQQQQSIK